MTATSKREKWVLSGALSEFAADGEFDLIREIIDLFLADTEEKMTILEQAVLAPDPVGAQRIGHSLKGAARQMGIQALGDAAERLEHSSPELDSAALSVFILEVLESWRESKQLVIETRGSLQPGSLIS